MPEFEEFRVQLSPAIQQPGAWAVQLVSSPLPGLNGAKGTVLPQFNQGQLQRLRSANGWPNQGELTQIGEAVWRSVMSPGLEGAFQAAVAFARGQGRGLRIVVSTIGDEPAGVGPHGVRLVELPVEALFNPANGDFIARNATTPVSRSLQVSPDRDAIRIALPLRVLIVTAAPGDQPPLDAKKEIQEIRKSLGQLIRPGGPVVLEVCEQATREKLSATLQQHRFHIIHFIAHGMFDVGGDDPSSRAYLCLVDQATGETDPFDADTLAVRLKSTGIRVAVFTACQSAAGAPAFPPQGIYPVRAFDGIAQKLLSAGESEVSAVVAMQFDLETRAAAKFSEAFYGALVQPGCFLDEAVSIARREIAVEMDAGHRAWVTPTVYWRCKQGKVFDFEPTRRTLPPEALMRLGVLDQLLVDKRNTLDQMARQPAEVLPLLEDMRKQLEEEISRLVTERAQIIGDTVRLFGGRVVAGREIECLLKLRLHDKKTIGVLRGTLKLPPGNTVTFVNGSPGAHANGRAPLTGADPQDPGALTLAIMLQPVELQAGEYELAKLRFRVSANVPASVVDILLSDVIVAQNGADLAMESLPAVLFVRR